MLFNIFASGGAAAREQRKAAGAALTQKGFKRKDTIITSRQYKSAKESAQAMLEALSKGIAYKRSAGKFTEQSLPQFDRRMVAATGKINKAAETELMNQTLKATFTRAQANKASQVSNLFRDISQTQKQISGVKLAGTSTKKEAFDVTKLFELQSRINNTQTMLKKLNVDVNRATKTVNPRG